MGAAALRLSFSILFQPFVEPGPRGGRPGSFLENEMMMTSYYRSANPVWASLAIGASVSILSLSPALAQSRTNETLPPVLVSTSRFASDPASAPVGATIIRAEEIQASGIGNVNEAVRKLGGVYGRQSFTGTQDFSLDLRGFGGAGDQNLVVMVDGVRLSDNEQVVALLSSIPIETVERIEIVRGGSSVLYGEGATGGTIQVITKRPQKNSLHGAVQAEAGSFGHRELRASLARGWENISVDINASTQRADNYRANSKSQQDNFSAGAQWADRQTRFGARVDVARQDARFPGSLTLAQFQADPRQATTPNDFGSYDTDRYTVFGEHRIGGLELAAELSHREKKAESTFVGLFGAFVSRADSRVTQFSPRARYLSAWNGWNNELVAGIDLAHWERQTVSNAGGFPAADADAKQRSRAVYLRNEIRAGAARLAIGARRESFDKNFSDPLASPTSQYATSDTLNAWEVQGAYAVLPKLDVFAKAGRSYRMPNVDDNGFTPVANQALLPQTSRDLEIGATAGDADNKLSAKIFRHRLKNEIMFDPTSPNPFSVFFPGSVGANVNLAPTERKGIELEGTLRLASAWALKANLQHVSAEFTDGPNAGREVVLVPHNTAALRLNWQPGTGHSANIGVQWADSQRYGGDFTNSCTARIPSYATLDARYAYRTGPWEFALAGSNLADRDFFSNAFGTCQSGIYPEAGRQIKASVRVSF
jgi:iron complex outermembrane receptor protein